MSRFSIRTRLLAVFLVLVGLGVAAQAYGFITNTRDIAALRDRSAALLELQRQGHQIEAAVRAEHDAIDAYLLTLDTSLISTYRAAQVTGAEYMGASQPMGDDFPSAAQDLGLLKTALAAWRARFAEPAIAAAGSASIDRTALVTLEETGVQLYDQVKTLQAHYDRDLTGLYADLVNAQADSVRTQTLVFVVSLLGVLVGLVVANWLMRRWMLGRWDRLLRTAQRVRDGEDVHFVAEGDDEIGRMASELERMRSGMQRQAIEAGIINRFTEVTAFVDSDGDVARATLDALEELTRPADGTIHISNRSRDRALPEGSIGPVQTAIIPLGQLSQCPGVRRSSRYVTPDLAAHLAVRCPLYPATSGTLACIPLIALGDVIGAVHLHWDHPDELALELGATMSRITDHASLAIANRRLVVALQGQASTDGRTGLPNSRAFDEALEHALASRSPFEPLAVLMLDIDHFKAFNDRNGHPAGDQALRTFARVLGSAIREGDLAARYGGEEFVAMLPGAAAEDAALVAERIRKRTEEAVIDLSPGQRDQITVSIGIAVFPDDATDRVTLLETADAALYRAKNNGRNQWVLAGEALETRAGSPVTAEAEIAADLAPVEGEASRAVVADDAASAVAHGAEADAPRPLRLPRAG